MCFNASFFVLHFYEALNSGSHFPGILFPGNMVIPTVLPLTLARRTVNAPEVRQANTHPVCPLHAGSYMLLLKTLSHNSIKLLKSWTKQNTARLSIKSTFHRYVSCTRGRRVAGFYPSCQTTTCARTHTDSQFRVANLLGRTHPDNPSRKNMHTRLGQSPDDPSTRLTYFAVEFNNVNWGTQLIVINQNHMMRLRQFVIAITEVEICMLNIAHGKSG